jgi:hypothetical protein
MALFNISADIDVSITVMQYNHSTQTRLRPHAGLKPMFGTSTLLRDTPPTPPFSNTSHLVLQKRAMILNQDAITERPFAIAMA